MLSYNLKNIKQRIYKFQQKDFNFDCFQFFHQTCFNFDFDKRVSTLSV